MIKLDLWFDKDEASYVVHIPFTLMRYIEKQLGWKFFNYIHPNYNNPSRDQSADYYGNFGLSSNHFIVKMRSLLEKAP